MDLSIIFVNWNSTDYLRECIASIGRHTTGINFEIIVVDNASPVQDVDTIRDAYPAVRIIKSSRNLGFAGANNLGFQNSSGRYILFLNPDTKLTSPAINVMLDCLLALPDAGILGCTLLNGDLSVQTSCIQPFPTVLNQALDCDFLRRLWPKHRLWGMAPLFEPTPDPAEVEVVSGACMLVRREVFIEAGMFSEEYFMYAEDLDLCYKLCCKGYRNYYTRRADVIHYGGKSSNPVSAVALRWKATIQYSVRNQGRRYATALRAAMTVAAVIRLGLLGGSYVLRLGGARRQTIRSGLLKWKSVLKTVITYSGDDLAENRV